MATMQLPVCVPNISFRASTMRPSIPRSYLFVPGNRPDRFAKACATGAGAVIIDLEDAVPPTEKDAARAMVAAWLSPAQSVLIRVNSAETVWFQDDLQLCKLPGVSGIVLPKAERIEEIAFAGSVSTALSILPLIESAQGFASVHLLAQAPNVKRLMFGTIDFQNDLGIGGDDEELLYFRSQLVLQSRLAGIDAPVDGVTTAINDVDQLCIETRRARRLGFGGKLCIHPMQVSHVNQCFSPTQDETAWAQRVLAAVSSTQGEAVAVDGKMVDRPVILRAQEILNEAMRHTS